jgi:hypothetical protein
MASITTLEMKMSQPQGIEMKLAMFAQRLDVLTEEYKDLKEDFERQQQVPQGYVTARELENLCPFMSRSTLGKMLNEFTSFFEGHHTKRGHSIYVNPERVIEFLLYPPSPEADMPKVRNAFSKQRPYIPRLQEMENKINEKRKKMEMLF